MKHTDSSQGLSPLATAVVVLMGLATAALLLLIPATGTAPEPGVIVNAGILEAFQTDVNNRLSHVLSGVMPNRQSSTEGGTAAPYVPVYTLKDQNLVAPEPNPEGFAQTQDPATLEGFLKEAQMVLKGQDTLFSTDTAIKEGSTVHTYLDETIFAVTWKQVFGDSTYTFSEVKIAHPSQLRRFLSEGTYGSGILHTTTEMSASVNAVVASSGDYYDYRTIGIVVNEGQVYRDRGHFLDTLYVNDKGEFLFTYAGEITDRETAQKFVDDNKVRFSLCFGPVMILDGEYRVPNSYNSGEINSNYPRAALCWLDELHYLVVAANTEPPNDRLPTIPQFAQVLYDLGVPTAYALDGGQTAAIVMNDQLINTVSYGSQREISDIFYFATALPEPKEE